VGEGLLKKITKQTKTPQILEIERVVASHPTMLLIKSHKDIVASANATFMPSIFSLCLLDSALSLVR
jgi:hypothetical protein